MILATARITRGAIALLSVFGLFLGSAATATATPSKPPKPPIEKVVLCVYDSDTSAWELASIKTSVADKLVARGVAAYPLQPVPGTNGAYVFDATCVPQPVTPVETIFAVAYSDWDPTDGAYNADADVLIAKLVDGNSDGILNAGDKVITNKYPKSYDITDWATQFGSFAVTEHVITASDGCYAGECYVYQSGPGSGWTFAFKHVALGSEHYLEAVTFGATTFITDDLGSAYTDKADIQSGSPSQPVDTMLVDRTGLDTDDAFVDVDIY